jgi:hypothetical protein
VLIASDFQPKGVQQCQDFAVVGSCVLTKGMKKQGDFRYGDIDLVRDTGPMGSIKLSGGVKHLGNKRKYELQVRGDGAPDMPLDKMAKSPLLASIGTFVTTEFGSKTMDISIPSSANISLWGENSVIGRSIWIVEKNDADDDDEGDEAIAKCIIGIDAVPNNFAHPPRKFLSIEKGTALMYPVSWDDLNGAKASEVSPSGKFVAAQTDATSSSITLTAEGLLANTEYTLEIHEYGDMEELGKVGRVFNPKLWGSTDSVVKETWLDARIDALKTDAGGKLSYQAEKNFTLNGWESIIGRSVVLMPKGSSAGSLSAIAGVIGIAAYDPNAESNADFFTRMKNKVVEVWNKIPESGKYGGGVFVVLLILGLFGGCAYCIMRRRQKHREAIQGGPAGGGLAAKDGQEMESR